MEETQQEIGEEQLREESSDIESSSSSCTGQGSNRSIIAQNSSDSSSSSPSFRSKVKRRRERSFPAVETSLWRYEHLQRLGIAYADTPVTLTEFMSAIKTHARNKLRGYEKQPSTFKKLEQITKDIWRFSFNYPEAYRIVAEVEKLNQVLHQAVKEVDNALKKMEMERKSIESQLSEEFDRDPNNHDNKM